MNAIQVQTDDQTQTQGDREKDPRLLSGGEKSFSTICLLLSMWECIGCPLRCLGQSSVLSGSHLVLQLNNYGFSDEFDVFMDAINRLISINTIVGPPS